TDGGQTWGPSGGVPIKTPKGNQTGVNVQGSFVAVGPDHAVYVSWWDGADGPTIRMRKSTDQGQTFGSEVIVTGLKSHGDLAVTPDGNHLGIFWYDRRNDPSNDSLIDRYGAIGTVSGHTVSFGANFRITDVSFPPAFNIDHPIVNPTYMGDYDTASADNTYF